MKNKLFIRKINWNITTGIVIFLVLGILCVRCIKVPDIETPVTLTISKESLTFTANGQQQTFSVTSNANCSATSDASWITISPSSFGSDKGLAFKTNEIVTMTVTATSNTSVTPRTATITINSSIPGVTEQTISVTQAAVTPNLVISLSFLNFAATSDEGQTFSITSNIDWTVRSDATWLSINPESGSNNGTVTVIANANIGDSRTAIITISGTGVTSRTITVIQAATDPDLSVSTSSLTFSASAEQQRFTITSNTNWTITSNQPWCTVQPASGNGNREITVNVTENTATTTRTATLTITAGNQSRQVNIIQIAKSEVIVPVETITLNKNTLSLNVGALEKLMPTIYPVNATNKTVNWSSSNPSVATVSNDATITAMIPGTASIIASTQDGGKTAICNVTVTSSNIPVTAIILNKTILQLNVGETEALIVIISPANATNKNVTWTSSNSNIATVSADGVVTAVTSGLGTATITATAADGSGITGTCVVTVNPKISVTGVSITPTGSSFPLPSVGSTLKLTAVVAPANATNQNVTWSSSNTIVATVAEDGTVIATGTGTATITVTTVDGGYTATCVVTVPSTNVPVTSVSLNQTTMTLNIGNTGTLIATISPANATNQNVIWTSSNPSVATVNANGMVTALSAGTTSITVTTQDGSKTATCFVTVVATNVPVAGVSLDETSLSIYMDNIYLLVNSRTLTATVLPTNATNKNVTWSSNAPTVAAVSSNGTVMALSAGTAIITVTTVDGGYTANCVVNVQGTPPVSSPYIDFGDEKYVRIHSSVIPAYFLFEDAGTLPQHSVYSNNTKGITYLGWYSMFNYLNVNDVFKLKKVGVSGAKILYTIYSEGEGAGIKGGGGYLTDATNMALNSYGSPINYDYTWDSRWARLSFEATASNYSLFSFRRVESGSDNFLIETETPNGFVGIQNQVPVIKLLDFISLGEGATRFTLIEVQP